MRITTDSERERISAAVNIREAAERYASVRFTRKGYCCCPFHSEKTPSFKIFDDDNSFYCFGCGAGGDVIKLVSLALGVSYYEAMKQLDADYALGLFERCAKTENSLIRERTAREREKRKKKRLSEKKQREYAKLTDYYKWVLERPESEEKTHDIVFLERLLDKWLDNGRVPEDFDAEALICALKSKFGKEWENG